MKNLRLAIAKRLAPFKVVVVNIPVTLPAPQIHEITLKAETA